MYYIIERDCTRCKASFFANNLLNNNYPKNEKWLIQGIENYPNCEVRIYTRWGQEVYKNRGYSEQKAWDGMIKSKKAASGVYFYLVNLNGEEKSEPIKGSITLIR